MNHWIITDTHLGHDKMQEKCGRPLGFETLIMDNLHCRVMADDVLIHLGDVCFGDDESWNLKVNGVPGKKWLVRGNHDSKSDGWYLKRGWDFVADQIRVKRFGFEIAFSHVKLEVGSWDLNIHGHTHNKEPGVEDKLGYVLLAVEHDYRPETLESIVKRYKKRG